MYQSNNETKSTTIESCGTYLTGTGVAKMEDCNKCTKGKLNSNSGSNSSDALRKVCYWYDSSCEGSLECVACTAGRTSTPAAPTDPTVHLVPWKQCQQQMWVQQDTQRVAKSVQLDPAFCCDAGHFHLDPVHANKTNLRYTYLIIQKTNTHTPEDNTHAHKDNLLDLDEHNQSRIHKQNRLKKHDITFVNR